MLVTCNRHTTPRATGIVRAGNRATHRSSTFFVNLARPSPLSSAFCVWPCVSSSSRRPALAAILPAIKKRDPVTTHTSLQRNLDPADPAVRAHKPHVRNNEGEEVARHYIATRCCPRIRTPAPVSRRHHFLERPVYHPSRMDIGLTLRVVQGTWTQSRSPLAQWMMWPGW